MKPQEGQRPGISQPRVKRGTSGALGCHAKRRQALKGRDHPGAALYGLLLLCLGTLAHTAHADPVFDIPRIDGITIDGKNDDWRDKGFRVETMVSDSGEVRLPWDFNPSFRLGWDDHGLLVLVTVTERQIVEADAPCDLDQKDSVEMLMGVAPGSPRLFRLLAGTGADPRFPQLRTFIRDRRAPPDSKQIEVETAVQRTPSGYSLEVRLPWSNLGISPEIGKEASFQLGVYDVDASGSRLYVRWCPGYRGTPGKPHPMYRIRLAAEPSPEMLAATRVVLDAGRPRVEVVAPSELAGKSATATTGDGVYATSRFEPDAGRARATLYVPLPGAAVSWSGGSTQIEAFEVNSLMASAIENVHVLFHPCVFSGDSFPRCGFEPSDAAMAIGKCTLTPTFYNHDYQEVKTATKPGRYGAIVEVKTPTGQSFKRFLTLYRTPGAIDWRTVKIDAGPGAFPPEFGLEPAVLKERSKVANGFLVNQMREGMERAEDAAAVLAGLSEMQPGAAAPRSRNAPYAMAQNWWYGLKKRTHNLRTDYYAHLPAAYGASTTKKWPLILYLHGSGERGYNINSVKNGGLARTVDTEPDFPFIFVAPQCSPGEWWSTAELSALLDRIELLYRVDPSRVYLSGLSMGGFGSWALAIDSPNRFAAVVPVCGGGDPDDADRLKGIPIWVFHGAKDMTVPIQMSQEMVDAVKKAGGNVKFTIFPEDSHDSWTDAYAMPELYDWLLKQHR